MERFTYWQDLAERLGTAGRREYRQPGVGPGIRLTQVDSKSVKWCGRELSQEAYLAVPTFLRWGLRPRV